MAVQLYRGSTVGMALTEALDEMARAGDPALALPSPHTRV